MKKILVIGASESIFVKDFIVQIANQDALVDLLSLSDVIKVKGVRRQVNVCADMKKGKLNRHINLLLALKDALAGMDKTYDCVVIHYINYFLAPHMFSLKKKTKNIVSVVWGSDFYRARRLSRILQNVIYLLSSSIVFTNPETRNVFRKKKNFVSGKVLKIARFGLPALDEINELRINNITREDACDTFGFPKDKVIISVGYNANVAHKQTLVIEKFALLPNNLRESALLIFPIGYGDPAIKEAILKVLLDNKIDNYLILERFFGFKDVAVLRCATDILINIQSTDQFSGTMQEVLYSGGRVIAGSWLPYEEIIENGAEIRKIDTIDEIEGALGLEIAVGKKKSLYPKKVTANYIEKSSSWKENIKIWNQIIFK